MRLLVVALAIAVAAGVAWAAENKSGGDNFFTDSINSVFDKLGKIGTDEEPIFNEDAKGIDKDILEYDRDSLGRRVPKSTVLKSDKISSPE